MKSAEPQTLEFPLIQAVLDRPEMGFKHEEFIYHRAGFSRLLTLKEDYPSFREFVRTDPRLPQYFHIFDANPQIIELFSNDREEIFNIRVRKRIRFTIDQVTPLSTNTVKKDAASICLMNQFNIRKIDEFELNAEKKFWEGYADLLQNAMPVCAFDSKGNPLSLCYACAVAGDLAEIDVITLPEHQKKGLALAVVQEFCRICFARGITPHWDCFEENVASLRTALKIGFKAYQKYNFLSIFNKKGV